MGFAHLMYTEDPTSVCIWKSHTPFYPEEKFFPDPRFSAQFDCDHVRMSHSE